MKLPDQLKLYVASMRKLIRVTAIAMTPEEGQRWQKSHPDDAAVAQLDLPLHDIVLFGGRYDQGVSFEEKPESKLHKALREIVEAHNDQEGSEAPNELGARLTEAIRQAGKLLSR